MITRCLLLSALVLSLPTLALAQFVCPPAPEHFAAERAIDGSIWISWDNPHGECPPATMYEFQAGTATTLHDIATFQFPAPHPEPRMRLRLSTPPTGLYYLRLFALSPFGGRSVASNETTLIVTNFPTIPPFCFLPPPAPRNFTAIVSELGAVGGVPVTFLWSSGGLPDGCPAPRYRLHVGTAPGVMRWTLEVGSAKPLELVAPSGTFYLRLTAYTLYGSSPASNEIRIDVP